LPTIATKMREQLIKLVKLQKMDTAIGILKAEIAEIPGQKASMDASLQEIKRQINEVAEQKKLLGVERKKEEMELAEIENEIKKHQQELYQIKTNEAYSKLQDEIKQKQEQKGKSEEEIIKFLDKDDEFANQALELSETLKRMEEESRSKKQMLDNRLAELEENLKKLLGEKEKLVQEIPPGPIKRYEAIAATKDGLAVVSVEGDHCGGCHVLLPSQVYEDLARDDRMVTCGNCGRILYLPEEEKNETESETTTKDIR
jgi:hypothetical protein